MSTSEPLVKIKADQFPIYDLGSPYATMIHQVTLNGEHDKRPWITLNLKEGWGEYIDEAKGYDHERGEFHTLRVDGEFAAVIQKAHVLPEDLGMFEDV
jgi:hypothetical protein